MGFLKKEKIDWRKKYNTLELKYEMLLEDIKNRDTEVSHVKSTNKVKKELWEKTLKEQEEEIIDLKTELASLENEKVELALEIEKLKKKVAKKNETK